MKGKNYFSSCGILNARRAETFPGREGLYCLLHSGEDVHDDAAADDQQHGENRGQVWLLLIKNHREDGHTHDAKTAPQRVGHANGDGAHGAGQGEIAQRVGANHQH